MKQFAINEELALSVLRYLHTQPYGNVSDLVTALSNLPVLVVKPEAESEPETQKSKKSKSAK